MKKFHFDQKMKIPIFDLPKIGQKMPKNARFLAIFDQKTQIRQPFWESVGLSQP